MARLPRLVLPGCAHLVLWRGLAHTPIFVDRQDRLLCLEAVRESARAAAADVHAYALDEHGLRLVVTPSQSASLAALMQGVGRRYVSAHHRRHGGRGTLWDGRYRAAPLEPGETTLQALAWIDGEGHGEVERCSRAHRLGGQQQSWLVDPPEFWRLGNTPFEREAAWRARLEAGVERPQAAALQRAAEGGWACGSAQFLDEVARRAGRPAAPRPAGRPRLQR